ncbi:hypothetical protein NMG60_11024076 [Bertholletia excelsa]
MAFASMLRRAASAVVPLAIRAIGSQRHHHCSALFSAFNRSCSLHRSLFPSVCQYSSKPSADVSLLQVLDSEINCAHESNDHDMVEEVPEGFLFKIEDNPGQQTISLARECQGETISAEVHMPDLITGEEDDNDGGHDDDTECGPCLEFGCSAYSDEIVIDSLSVKDTKNSEDQIAYEGPDFSDLDENLQKAFHKYLEIRGIKPSTTNFLHEYMINKDSREYLMWLKNLKKFIEA